MNKIKYKKHFFCNKCGNGYVVEDDLLCRYCGSEDITIIQIQPFVECDCGCILMLETIAVGTRVKKDA